MNKPKVISCPRCQGIAQETTPQGFSALKGATTYYTCTVCATMVDESGKQVVTNLKDLGQINSVAAASSKMMKSLPGFEKMGPTAHALFQAKLTEMALEMWFDGYKHGVLCHAVGEAYDKSKETQNEN